jgi:hypothetical protein
MERGWRLNLPPTPDEQSERACEVERQRAERIRIAATQGDHYRELSLHYAKYGRPKRNDVF